MNLAPDFLNLDLKNPLVLASGILGVTGANLAAVAQAGAGAVTTKSIWLKRHAGHPNPTVLYLGNGNMINAVGLPHGGIEEARIEIESYRKIIKNSSSTSSAKRNDRTSEAIEHSPQAIDAPLFASIAGSTIEEYIATAKAVFELKPDLIELNISCPNVEDEFGKPFACDRGQAEKATSAVKKVCENIPLAVKLSPNVENIAVIAKSVESAGADAITAINTIGPGLVIDIETAQPILANKFGGLSGPAIRPIAVKAVFEIYQAVKIPIIGMGGISSGRDAIEIMQAGATLVGIGSAAWEGVGIFSEISQEIEKWCESHNIKNISDLIGSAHKKS